MKAFCDTVEEAGYYSMVYLNSYVMKNKVYVKELADYGIWYADYSHKYLNTDFRVDMWQYSDTGIVSGIKGYVDLNVIFLENSIFAKIFAED
jgi:GH25 family lysozyme M1 (1,4-beta-N-acetylmuramidase)